MPNIEPLRAGGLNSIVVTTDARPACVTVLCHGYGAPSDDLVPVAAQLLHTSRGLVDRVQLVFPEAPLSLAAQGIPRGRAWWPLNIDRLIELARQGDFQSIRRNKPEGLEYARDLLLAHVSEIQQQLELPWSRVVLGGFSQGSMLALETALSLPEPPGGLILWSTALTNEDSWRQRGEQLRDVRVVQSHGREDEILDFSLGEACRDWLIECGAKVNFHAFRGPHTIPMEALLAAGRLIEDVANAR